MIYPLSLFENAPCQVLNSGDAPDATLHPAVAAALWRLPRCVREGTAFPPDIADPSEHCSLGVSPLSWLTTLFAIQPISAAWEMQQEGRVFSSEFRSGRASRANWGPRRERCWGWSRTPERTMRGGRLITSFPGQPSSFVHQGFQRGGQTSSLWLPIHLRTSSPLRICALSYSAPEQPQVTHTHLPVAKGSFVGF